jgi:hypothetical protein
MWTITNLTAVKKDVEWIKKVLSPALWVAILSSVVSLILLAMRLIGR